MRYCKQENLINLDNSNDANNRIFHNGIVEVVGSIPSGSTIYFNDLAGNWDLWYYEFPLYPIKLQPFFKERNENFLSTDGISGFIKF
jgi:hypothetical protein